MVSVKVWLAWVPTPLDALKVTVYVPPVPAPGVPLNTPVVVLKLSPEGSVPVSLNVSPGKPLAVTVKLPAVPAVNVALLALVMAGAWSIVSVNVWLAAVPTPLEAVMVTVYVPPVPAPGVPLNAPVDVLKVTPVGNVPVSPNVGAGEPVAVTVKVPAVPT